MENMTTNEFLNRIHHDPYLFNMDHLEWEAPVALHENLERNYKYIPSVEELAVWPANNRYREIALCEPRLANIYNAVFSRVYVN